MTTMLAVRAHSSDAPLVLEEIPVPKPGPRDVLVKVASAGLVAGNIRLLLAGMFKNLPTTVGHESAGTIVAVGDEVTGIEIGDRVRVHGVLTCGECRHCRADRDMMCPKYAISGHAAFGTAPMPLYDEYHNGGLAEYIRVPRWLVDKLPDSVSFDIAAKVHDLANALRTVKCANLEFGSTIVVTAASGTMGTATVKLAEHLGVGRMILVGRNAKRLEAVAQLSGSVPVDTLSFSELPDDWVRTGGLTRRLREMAPEGIDGVIDYLTDHAEGVSQAMMATTHGGTLVHMGGNLVPIAIPPLLMMTNCWRFVGTRGISRSDATQILRMLASGALNVDELITHRFPLTDAVKAAEAILRREEPMWMTVINP